MSDSVISLPVPLDALETPAALLAPESFALRAANAAFLKLTRRKPEDPEPSALAELLLAPEQEPLREAIAAGEPALYEGELKAGRRSIAIDARLRPLRIGETDVILVEMRDLSKLRQLEIMLDSYSTMVERRSRELEREKAQVEKLLRSLMPNAVYEEFKNFGVVSPQRYDPVSVLMLDFVGFTDMAAASDPTVTVAELNDIFSAFDRIAEQFGCERIKTLGDSYLAVAGMPSPNIDHAPAVANCAIRFRRYLERRNETHPNRWRCRIGLASGAVVGSVVGVQKYVYDVFGPAVNLASRLQSHADPMEIIVCTDLIEMLPDGFAIEERGIVNVRGFGEIRTARLGA